jgi:L-fuculose-phosphate aldolase
MFNCLQEYNLIETGINKNNRSTPLASADLAIHRAIYQETQALAIVHAHPPHAVALSMTEAEIVPSVEGLAVTGVVPVVDWKVEEKLRNLAHTVARTLKQHRIIMVRNQGSFAIGQLLEEAYNFTTALEQSSQVLCLTRTLQVNPVK